MTVEIENSYTKLGEDFRQTEREVAEFRTIEKKEGDRTSLKKKNIVILHMEPADPNSETTSPKSLTLGRAISKDEVEVFDSSYLFNKTNIHIYTGEEINQANIVDDKGMTRFVWRKTEPGDYPEPEDGWTVAPIQLDFKLH